MAHGSNFYSSSSNTTTEKFNITTHPTVSQKAGIGEARSYRGHGDRQISQATSLRKHVMARLVSLRMILIKVKRTPRNKQHKDERYQAVDRTSQ